MTHDGDKGGGRAGGFPKKKSRQDRLKLALRENLKRRKSQARGRSDPDSSSRRDAASPHDGGEETSEESDSAKPA